MVDFWLRESDDDGTPRFFWFIYGDRTWQLDGRKSDFYSISVLTADDNPHKPSRYVEVGAVPVELVEFNMKGKLIDASFLYQTRSISELMKC
jgi:hypothetical protein